MREIALNPVNNVYIAEAFSNKSLEDINALFVSRYLEEKDSYRSLLKFDLTSLNGTLPSNISINSAILRLNIVRNEIPKDIGNIKLHVHNILDSYAATVTWATQPLVSDEAVSVKTIQSGYLGNIEINLTSLVREWWDETSKNKGIMLKGNESIHSIVMFKKYDGIANDLSPKLIIRFSEEKSVENDLTTFWGLYNHKSKYYQTFLDQPFTNESLQIINNIKNKQYKGIVVYPQAVFWQPVQRPQQLLRELAQKGYLCFFCDPPVGEFSITEVQENLFIINNEAYLLPILRSKSVIVICSWLMQMAWADLLPNKFLWYDVLDKMEFFTMHDQGMEEKHELVLKEADYISYSSELLKRYVIKRNDAVYLPNGCNINEFTTTKDTKIPPKINALLQQKKPIIGYFGAVEEWFDTDLINNIASRNPDWQFVIIGKLGIDAASLEAPNIHLFGLIPYEELPQYATHFDVAITPFIINDLTNCVSPIKFFEYAALGKPVVTTPILEMKKYQDNWVILAEGTNNFETAIKSCLSPEVQLAARENGRLLALNNQWLCRVEAFEEQVAMSPKGWSIYANIGNDNTVAIMTATFLDFDGSSFYSGGAERYLIDLEQTLAQSGLKTLIYQCGNSSWVRRYKDTDIISLATGDLDAKEFTVKALNRFNKRFYEIVEGRTSLNIYSAFFLGYPYTAKPSIGISHGVAWDSPSCNFNNGTQFWNSNEKYIEAAKQCEYLVSVDTNTPNWFQTINYNVGNKILYFPNYVDLEQFYAAKNFILSKEKVVILFPRRMYEARGFYMTLNVIDYFLEKYPNVEFHFVGRGTGEDIDYLIEKQNKWPERVKVYHLLPEEMPEVYRKADITLIPTLYSEGTSLACTEAMASGNAVIATRVGGLCNLVINDFNGYLIEPSTEALREAIENLLKNPEKLFIFKQRAVQIAETFSKEKWQQSWQTLIQKFNFNKTLPKHNHLTEIFLKDLSISKIKDFGNMLVKLLTKGDLVYIKVKNHPGPLLSFGRIQWVPWDETEYTTANFVIAEESLAQELNRKIDMFI